MIESKSISRNIFLITNYFILASLGAICILPFIHIFSVSLSSPAAVSAGAVKLLPIGFNLDSYIYILKKVEFLKAFKISVVRVLIGSALCIFFTVLTAYPLSKESNRFKMRTVYLWFFIIPMLFSGGLIPTYMTIRGYGLIDHIWALVLPSAVQGYYIILMLNFFRGLPRELDEAAYIDGAGHWKILLNIYLPLSLPSLATILLFTMVAHWNSWFDGIIYMNKTNNYPLQTYLQTIVIQPNLMQIQNVSEVANITDRTIKTSQIFVGMLPILLVYPFLQRYFISGIVLGSVKG